jgi:hypothetical protein
MIRGGYLDPTSDTKKDASINDETEVPTSLSSRVSLVRDVVAIYNLTKLPIKIKTIAPSIDFSFDPASTTLPQHVETPATSSTRGGLVSLAKMIFITPMSTCSGYKGQLQKVRRVAKEISRKGSRSCRRSSTFYHRLIVANQSSLHHSGKSCNSKNSPVCIVHQSLLWIVAKQSTGLCSIYRHRSVVVCKEKLRWAFSGSYNGVGDGHFAAIHER